MGSARRSAVFEEIAATTRRGDIGPLCPLPPGCLHGCIGVQSSKRAWLFQFGITLAQSKS